jgi:hypothetical protein
MTHPSRAWRNSVTDIRNHGGRDDQVYTRVTLSRNREAKVDQNNLTHSRECGSTTYRLRSGGRSIPDLPGLVVCDACGWSSGVLVDWLRRCERCNGWMPAEVRGDARYCSGACRQAAYRDRRNPRLG